MIIKCSISTFTLLKTSENFQEYRYIDDIGLKKVSLYNCKLLESKQITLFCFDPFETIWEHCFHLFEAISTMMCFFNPSKYKESFVFLIFSISLELYYCAKIWSFIFLIQVVFILSENGAFYVKFASFWL